MAPKVKTDIPPKTPVDPGNNVDTADASISSDLLRTPENLPSEAKEEEIISAENGVHPSAWHIIGRLLHESIYTLFFIGLHWVMKIWLIFTGQENEWWAQYLLTLSIIFALIAFTIIFGCELLVDCKRAIEYLLKNFRRKKE
jgi:hypothetical protein